MDTLAQMQTAQQQTKLGTVTFATPSLRQKLDIERRRSFYSGALPVISSEGADLADMFATLDVVMTDCPSLKRVAADQSSWDYDSLYDENALKDVYDKYNAWKDSFRNPVAIEQTQVGEA